MPYYKKRTRESYLGKTPESEARRLANIKRGDRKKTPEEAKTEAIKYRETKKKLQDLNIIEFATDPNFLDLSFKERPAQEVILRVIYGLPLNDDQLKIYQKITKNKREFEAGLEKEEAILVLGARSGKSLIASVIALFESTRQKWQKYLNKGESGYAVIVSTRQKQSEQIIQANCLRLMQNSNNLKGLIKDFTMSELTLKNNMKIVSSPCLSDSYRGVPIIFLACDEIGHFFVEGPKADSEILGALLPRMSQFYGAKLILVSTPAGKQGSLWSYYDKGFKEHKRLTAQSDSLFMNPLINKDFLGRERKRDLGNYRREFLAQFSEKVEAFFDSELIKKPFTLAGDLPYKSGYCYSLGLDQSGLSGLDRFALSISHKEGDIAIVDIVRSWETKDLDIILNEIETMAKTYFISEASIDKYSKGYVEYFFKKINIEIKIRPSLAIVFVNLKAKMIQDKLQLPDRPDLKEGLKNTIAVYGKSNQLTIFHERGPTGHADELDAVCGSIFEATREGEQNTGKLLDDISENIKADRRMGRNRRLSSQYDEEMREEADQDWNGPGDQTTPDW